MEEAQKIKKRNINIISWKCLSPLKSQIQTRRYATDAAFFLSAKKKTQKLWPSLQI